MAIAFVQSVTSQVAGTDDNTTATISVTAGNAIFVAIGSFFAINSAKDSFDNDTSKYALDVTAGTGSVFAAVYSRFNFPSSGSYTFTVNSTGGYSSITVMEFSGIMSSTAFDKSATGGGTGTSHTSNATAALSQNDEVAIGIGTDAAEVTHTTTNAPPWVQVADLVRTLEGYEEAVSAYRIVSDGAAQTFTFNSSGSMTSVVAIATYKGITDVVASMPSLERNAAIMLISNHRDDGKWDHARSIANWW